MAKKPSSRKIHGGAVNWLENTSKNPSDWGESEPLSDTNAFDQLSEPAETNPQEALASFFSPPPDFQGFRAKPAKPLPADTGELLAEWFDKFALFKAAFIPTVDDRTMWANEREAAWRWMQRLTTKLIGLMATETEARPLAELSAYSAWNLVPGKVWDSALYACKWLNGKLPVEPERPNEDKAERLTAATANDAPQWNAKRRELSFRGAIVKKYRQPAKNQEAILEAFQVAGWPASLDDPLPYSKNGDSRQRLADAVLALNKIGSLVFELNGKQQLIWKAKPL